MAFNKTDLDNIKSKIQISSELEKKTKIIKKGKDVWCCCPFHNEKTPSCKINDDLGSFYCFGCGAKGDIFTIYQDLFNYTFLDAVKELSERAGVKINFDQKSDFKKNNNYLNILEIATKWFEQNLNIGNNECQKYLDSRLLSKETIKSHFQSSAIDNKIKNQFISLLNECEFARYAPISNKNAQMDALLEKAKNIIITVETALK